MVTVAFEKKGEGTFLHSRLPNETIANAHEKGWNSMLDTFSNIFVGGSHSRK
jgi:hypothetical protein